jgi:hypothetical protein
MRGAHEVSETTRAKVGPGVQAPASIELAPRGGRYLTFASICAWSLGLRQTRHGVADLNTRRVNRALTLLSYAVISALLLGLLLIADECASRAIGNFDEPLHYLSALLVRRGELPHLDFQSVYPPFNYQPTAWIFALLGETAFAARLLQLLIYLLLLIAVGSLFRFNGARGWRLWSMLLFSVGLTAAMPLHISLLGATLALLAIVSYLYATTLGVGRRRLVSMALAGLLVGMTLLTRVNFALYVTAVFGADQIVEIARARQRGSFSLRAWLTRDVAPLALPVAGCLLSLCLRYGGQVREVFKQVVTTPAYALAQYAYAGVAWDPSLRGWLRLVRNGWLLPIVPLLWLVLRARGSRARLGWLAACTPLLAIELWLAHNDTSLLPILVIPAALAVLTNQLLGAALDRYEFIALFGCCIFLHYYLSRPDIAHQLLSTAPALLLLPAVFATQDSQPAARFARLGMGLLLFVLARPIIFQIHPKRSTFGATLGLVRSAFNATSDASRIATEPLPLAPPLGTLYPDMAEDRVVQYVRARTREDEAVYVGLNEHTRPYVNDMRLTWALGRRVGTRHFMLMSGITNTLEAEQTMIADLRERQVRWVVLWHAPRRGSDGVARPLEAGSRLLDDYIRKHYRPVATFGEFTICKGG